MTSWHREHKGKTLRFLMTALGLLVLRPAILVLGALWTINVVGVHLLVLLLLLFRKIFPTLPLFRRETLPLLTDHLGQIRLALLLDRCRRSALAVLRTLCAAAFLTAFPPEQDKSVLGTLDVILVALAWSSLYGITTERLSSLW